VEVRRSGLGWGRDVTVAAVTFCDQAAFEEFQSVGSFSEVKKLLIDSVVHQVERIFPSNFNGTQRGDVKVVKRIPFLDRNRHNREKERVHYLDVLSTLHEKEQQGRKRGKKFDVSAFSNDDRGTGQTEFFSSLGMGGPPAGNTPGDYVQVHHIIPQQLCKEGGRAHPLLVQLAAHGLFVRDDLAANGVALPTVKGGPGDGGLGSLRTIHQGSHPINSQLDGIHSTYGGVLATNNLVHAAAYVAALQTGHLVAGTVPPGATGFGDIVSQQAKNSSTSTLMFHCRKLDAAHHVSTTK